MSQDDCNTIGDSVSETLSKANSVLYSDQLSPGESYLLDNSEPLPQSDKMATYAGAVEGVQSTGMPPTIPSNPSNTEMLWTKLIIN